MPLQVDERVEVGKSRRRGGVGRVVGRNVDRLHAGNCPTSRRGNPLLEFAQLGPQGRLITHGAWHPSQERGHFASCLGEPENVVDEQERVRSGRVAEPFGHCEGRKGDSQTGPGRLIHLAENHASLFDDRTIGFANLGFLHFEPKIVPLASSLADTREDRVAAVCAGDAGNQLRQNNRLAETGPAEQSGLSTADERRQQVDDLDARLENLGLGTEILHLGRCAVNGPAIFSHDIASTIDWITQKIEDAAERSLADRDSHRGTGIVGFHSTDHPVGRAQRDTSHASAAQVLLHFARDLDVNTLHFLIDLESVVNFRKRSLGKFRIEGRSDDLRHATDVRAVCLRIHLLSLVALSRPSLAALRCSLYSSAAAPPMISLSSDVICV